MWQKIKNFFFRSKQPDHVCFDNTTRTVKSNSGMKVDVYNDWPDGMADVIADCFESGKVVSGKIENGKLTRDKEE